MSQVTELLGSQPTGPCPSLMLGATCPSGSHLLRVEEYVSKALQAGHADLRAGVLEALSQYSQGSLFRKHLQQGRAIEELGAPESKVAQAWHLLLVSLCLCWGL